MMQWRATILFSIVVLSAAVTERAGGAEIELARDGQPVAAIVVAAAQPSNLLLDRSASMLCGTVKNWAGVDLPTVSLIPGQPVPKQPCVVLGTLERVTGAAPELETDPSLKRARFLADDGFAVIPDTPRHRVLVTSKTTRGVFNGAQYVRDFCIDGDKNRLSFDATPVFRSPALRARAVYTLTIWKWESQYTAADWATIFDSFERDGLNEVYFWVSGHCPSQRYPQTYKVADEQWDTTRDSKIATLDDLRQIIRSAHERGLRLYLGGGMGGWVGTRFITNLAPGTVKTGPKYSLCPSNQTVHDRLVDYFTEMFDALPDADGIYLESADEDGECKCEVCQNAVDSLGSKQFGQSQLAILQDMTSSVWRRHPSARFVYTIGYAEHAHDSAYYEVIRRMSSDPRFEWMEARESWSFPGRDGKTLPASYFSPQVMHWGQYYARPLERMVADADRVAASGMYGMIYSFEPGFSTGSFYKQIPFPTELLPYALTGFVFREVTWDPTASPDELHARVRTKFFGKGAPAKLEKDLWAMRELIRSVSSNERPASADVAKSLREMDADLQAARPTPTPKAQEGMALLQRAIDDTRAAVGLK